jgi:hypothetical protein
MKEKLLNQLSGLSERERTILTFLATFLMLMLFIVTWYLMELSIDSAKSTIVEQEKVLQKMISMKMVYKKAQVRNDKMKSSIDGSSVNLNSDISTVKESVGVDIRSLKELKPRVKSGIIIERTEINMSNVTLESALAFLYGIENKSRYIFIDSLSIKNKYNKKSYYVNAVIAALKKGNENE